MRGRLQPAPGLGPALAAFLLLAPLWRGGVTVTAGGRPLAVAWFTAAPGDGPNVVAGTWSLVDPSGKEIASGTWSARKSEKGWTGAWRALRGKQEHTGSWTADPSLPPGAPLTALFDAALRSAVRGGWRIGARFGEWALRSEAAK